MLSREEATRRQSFHFVNGNPEAQRGEGTCPRSHSPRVAEPAAGPIQCLLPKMGGLAGPAERLTFARSDVVQVELVALLGALAKKWQEESKVLLSLLHTCRQSRECLTLIPKVLHWGHHPCPFQRWGPQGLGREHNYPWLTQ